MCLDVHSVGQRCSEHTHTHMGVCGGGFEERWGERWKVRGCNGEERRWAGASATSSR